MNKEQRLVEVLGWEIDDHTGLVVLANGEEHLTCCDDSFMRLVERELEKRGLAKKYAGAVRDALPLAWTFSLITAPVDVKMKAALAVLEEE